MRLPPAARFVPFLVLLPLLSLVGCTSQSGSGSGGGGTPAAGRQQFLSMGTAPVGGAFPVVGGAIAEVLNAHKGPIPWKIQAKGTKGSQENIRRLQDGDLQIALSNAAISYFAVRGEASWDKPYDIRAVATLAPNVAMFITRADAGIRSIKELKGKRVIVGPSGAGLEMFVRPLVEAHGLGWDDFTRLNANQSDAVDQLGDGAADAAFLGGAVPTAAISQAASTYTVAFVPYDEAVRQKLIADYAFFDAAVVPAGTYRGLNEDFQGLNVGSMHLITSAAQDEELIYQITKTMWEHRGEIAEQHAAGKAINEKNVARDTGVEYHPGAIRFYKEIGIWSEVEGGTQTETPATSAPELAPETAVQPEAASRSP